MIIAFIIFGLVLWSQTKVIGYAVSAEPSTEYLVKDFDSLDDAMEYSELLQTGWYGSITDFYKWKGEE